MLLKMDDADWAAETQVEAARTKAQIREQFLRETDAEMEEMRKAWIKRMEDERASAPPPPPEVPESVKRARRRGS